jgi:hypothetical protein
LLVGAVLVIDTELGKKNHSLIPATTRNHLMLEGIIKLLNKVSNDFIIFLKNYELIYSIRDSNN